MRSPDCVIIFHSNRSVEVEPLLLIILKTDFLSRNDQSILNIYSLILSKKNKPSPVRIFAQHESRRRKMEQSLSLRRIQSILHRRDNKRDSANFAFNTVSFVETYFSRKWVGSRESEVDSSSIKCETGKFATREI